MQIIITILELRLNTSAKIKARVNGIGNRIGSLEKYLYPKAANKAVNALPNAGFNVSFCKILNCDSNVAKNTTPKAIITVVTIVDVATLIVETTSPSAEPCFTPASSLALTAQGTFKFTKFPVINPKYVPLVPKSGEYVITSTAPLKKKIIIAVSVKAVPSSLKSGSVFKIIAIINGTAKMTSNAVPNAILPKI